MLSIASKRILGSSSKQQFIAENMFDRVEDWLFANEASVRRFI